MGKNVAVFVDVANIFYAAKAAGVDIDYVTLLKASSAGRDLVRAYAYTGLDPDNENQRNFHDFLRRHGYKVVSKDIRKYGDGKVKANLDIELVVDMMKTARNLDIAIVVSGDGDFAPAIRAVQEQGVRVEVVSFRGNTSSDLMDVADQFTDITQIAKVEKGSSRSGRRVATDDADLSMTEVPDKQSEGTGDRGRGRGRTRRVTGTTGTATRGRTGRVAAAAAAEPGDAPIVVLPGEKLSRAAAAPAPLADMVDEDLDIEELDGDAGEPGDAGDEAGFTAGENGTGEDGRRRRRRRGGRGRGRGRGRDDGSFVEGEDAPAAAAAPVARGDDGDEDDEVEAPAPARRAPSTFGSVWDSQIGVPASRGAPLLDDDEDLDEPAVPEYLIAERRRNAGGRGGPRGGAGGRGRGGAYAAALDRERFGGGRGSTPSRFGEPPPRREGAFGRPDRDERPPRDDRPPRGGDRGDRGDRRPPFRDVPRPAPRPSGDEPWSEVPPEIEAMLRAQLASRPAAAPRREAPAPPVTSEPVVDEGAGVEPAPSTPGGGGRTGRRSTRTTGEPTGATPTRGRSRRATADADAGTADAAVAEDSAAPEAAPAKPARRTTRRSTGKTGKTGTAEVAVETVSGDGEPAAEASTSTTARRTTRSRTSRATAAATTDAAVTPESTDAAPAAEAPKRRTTRRKAEPAA